MVIESTLAAFAKEAVKPASGLVDAAIAPQIARVKTWATDRDLQARLDSGKLAEAIGTYLRQLARRVSTVTTIVYPQQAISLPEIYEPLTLIDRYRGMVVSSDELMRTGARTHLVDSAGMGKSTFARHLVLSALAASDQIPVLLELRRTGESQTLVDAIAGELDQYDRPFDRDVLLRLISLGRFFIVLDGFDELPAARRAAVASEIEQLAVKAPDCAIVLTSRPELDLPPMPDAQVVGFDDLSTESVASLLKRYDRVGASNVGERLIARLDEVPARFLQTPLLAALLYRTFGFNGSISTRISTFYDEVYSALYKGHDLSKAAFAREKTSGLDVDDFRRLLRGFAFLLISQQIVSLPTLTVARRWIEAASRLTGVFPSSSEAYLDDLLIPVPLLIRDGAELRFIHRTFAEFFAAEFIATSTQQSAVVDKVQSPQMRDRFLGALSFLAEVDPALFRARVAAPIAREVVRDLSGAVLPNPAQFSLQFLGIPVYVGLWPSAEVWGKGEGQDSVEMADGEAEVRATVYTFGVGFHPSRLPESPIETDYHAFFYGEIDGEAWVAVVTGSGPARALPDPAWQLITVPAALDSSRADRLPHEVDLQPLLDRIGARMWVRVDTPELWDVDLSPTLERIALDGSTLTFLGLSDPRGGHRTISEAAARSILAQVEAEAEAQEWLDELLSESK